MHFAVKTHCNMQSKRSVICSKTQDTWLGLNLLYTFFWLLLLDWFTNFYLLTEQPYASKECAYTIQDASKTRSSHVYRKKTPALIQGNTYIHTKESRAYAKKRTRHNKISSHQNPIVNRLAQRNACTCTKKNTPLYKEVPCTYTKKYMRWCEELGCLYWETREHVNP